MVAGPLVWIVDDDEDNRDVIADVLGSEGFRVRVFPDGKGPLDLISAPTCDELPALVLLDLVIPGGVDGLAFLAARRAHEALATVPVVLMSGADHATRVLTGVEDDIVLLQKPFDLDELLHVVGRALEAAVTETQAASA